MFNFLLVVQAIIGFALVVVILIQRSEGGGLSGGNPAAFMSVRGAADLLTRTTTILAILFVGLAILLAALATQKGQPQDVDTSLVEGASSAVSDVDLDPITDTGAGGGGNSEDSLQELIPAKPEDTGAIPLDQ